jgi:LacI family transcriptional regulator
MALAVMQAAQALGRRVPDDLSIIGFDNIDLAEHVTPALTTMHVDKVGMGRLAVQLLTNRTQFPNMSYVTTALRPTLIERGYSTSRIVVSCVAVHGHWACPISMCR